MASSKTKDTPKTKKPRTRLTTVNKARQALGINTEEDKKVSALNHKTFDGHRLTIQEAKFISNYLETGNQRQSVIDAGYRCVNPGYYAIKLLSKAYINNEINHRLKELESRKIANAEEIMQYFTGVMRGEIKDQFGLDAPLGERTKAAQELAKRKIDMVERVSGNRQAEVRISLTWNDNEPDDDNVVFDMDDDEEE